MIYKLDPDWIGFPDANKANRSGIIAIEGDLSPKRLLAAYAAGIFPWYNEETEPILWWSPDPRMVLFPRNFRLSHSLLRTIKSHRFEVKIDTCFNQVMRCCQTTARPNQSGTWINERMIDSYTALHEKGFAHSFETFLDGELVGGLYGICLNDKFFGESMFHHVTDASKVAFARLVEFATIHGFQLIDAQQETKHLSSLGANPISRARFLEMIKEQTWPTIHWKWKQNNVVLLIGGNQGNRGEMIAKAAGLIDRRIGPIERISSIYETDPWGFEAEQTFFNQALVIGTDLSPERVLDNALSIEAELGRVRKETEPTQEKRTYTSRPIDIDLIFYNSEVIDTPRLTIPHPRMPQRRFVLTPLAEIMPDFIHPVSHKRMDELLKTCDDTGSVRKIKDIKEAIKKIMDSDTQIGPKKNVRNKYRKPLNA